MRDTAAIELKRQATIKAQGPMAGMWIPMIGDLPVGGEQCPVMVAAPSPSVAVRLLNESLNKLQRRFWRLGGCKVKSYYGWLKMVEAR